MTSNKRAGREEEYTGTWSDTKWPECAPSIHEEKVVTVSIGNTQVRWAMQERAKGRLSPTLFWKTDHVKNVQQDDNPLELLATLLPPDVHTFVFGADSADPTKENAIRASLVRRVNLFKIFMVSTNQKQLQLFSWLFGEIPCTLHLFQGDDFFTISQGRYPEMGVDRLCNMRAAGDYFNGFPALVFDGGTAATYTACDANGKIMGGAIGPGILAKLRSLGDYADALPHIHTNELIEQINTYGEEGRVFQTFERSVKPAIISSVLTEVAQHGQCVIRHFLNQVGPATVSTETGEESKEIGPNDDGVPGSVNSNRTILVTGGDGDILEKLLQPDHSRLIERTPGDDMPPYEIRKVKHMIHYGMAAVLQQKMEEAAKEPHRDMDLVIIGQRIAKNFPSVARDADGDSIFRGAVSAVAHDGNYVLYSVRYDDNDTEDLEAPELYEALLLYSKVGEKNSSQGSGVTKKKEQAKEAAKRLSEKSDAVKEAIAKKKRAQSAPPAVARAPAVVPAPARNVASAPPPETKRPAAAPAASADEPKPKKQKTTAETPKPVSRKKAPEYVGDRVAKYFLSSDGEQEVFFGTVEDYEYEDGINYWGIAYDDGDKEDFQSWDDLLQAVKLYEKKMQNDKKATAS